MNRDRLEHDHSGLICEHCQRYGRLLGMAMAYEDAATLCVQQQGFDLKTLEDELRRKADEVRSQA